MATPRLTLFFYVSSPSPLLSLSLSLTLFFSFSFSQVSSSLDFSLSTSVPSQPVAVSFRVISKRVSPRHFFPPPVVAVIRQCLSECSNLSRPFSSPSFPRLRCSRRTRPHIYSSFFLVAILLFLPPDVYWSLSNYADPYRAL